MCLTGEREMFFRTTTYRKKPPRLENSSKVCAPQGKYFANNARLSTSQTR